MNFEIFMVKRILFKKEKNSGSTRSIIRIAIGAVALSMAVMLISLFILQGFQKEIRDKVVGFGSHIQITGFEGNNSFEVRPVNLKDHGLSGIRHISGVLHMQMYALKAGIIKSGTEIEGIVLKGIGPDFDKKYFSSKLKEGQFFNLDSMEKSNGILVSNYTAKRLSLHTGDEVVTYFIQNPPRARKFRISGIYETGLEELDKVYALCDIRHIQKLNDWSSDQVAGIEVLTDNFDKVEERGKTVYNALGYHLNSRTIKEIYPQIFDWLKLQDINVTIIITLMLLVAGINMVTALLIIILERVSFIGLMKALGAENLSIRKIFLYTALYLCMVGLFFGNLFGLGLAYLQYKFHLIPLAQESYYVSFVPIWFDWKGVLLLNAGAIISCSLMMLLPSLIIYRIQPVKAIRFR